MPPTCLNDRAVISIAARSGDPQEAADFLQGVVTADVKDRLPTWSALLTPQGKVLFEFIVWAAHDGLLVDCEAAAADALAKRLKLYRLRREIDIVRENRLTVHWAPRVVEGAANDPRLDALGYRWIAPINSTAAAPSAPGADEDWRVHRLRLGVAEGHKELGSGETFWLECNAMELHGVSFTKGCFVGNENTAGMNWRQKINRRLLVVPLAQSDQKRQRVAYPALGLAVDLVRVEKLGTAGLPKWLITDPDHAA
jgi:folate-binding protein YgfZ